MSETVRTGFERRASIFGGFALVALVALLATSSYAWAGEQSDALQDAVTNQEMQNPAEEPPGGKLPETFDPADEQPQTDQPSESTAADGDPSASEFAASNDGGQRAAPRAKAVGETFIEPTQVGSDASVPCGFTITDAGADNPRVELGYEMSGSYGTPAIPLASTGAALLSETITDEQTGIIYTATAFAPFVFDGSGITDTGFSDNTTVRVIGDLVCYRCLELESTGLEGNGTVTQIGNRTASGGHTVRGAFASCPLLEPTGFWSGSAIEDTGLNTFNECTGLTSPGLETNQTIAGVNACTFRGCIKLGTIGTDTANKAISC